MDVTWYGHGCFRLRGKGAAVVTDPYPPSLGPKLPRLEADLVTVSHDHDNHSYVRVVGKDPYLIDGPGEYEVGGVTVLGVATYHDAQNGNALGRNTVYLIEVDDVRVCHLGDLGHTLDDEALERLGDVDVLLVPVGGGNALDASHGAEVVRQVEPRFVVPMHYALPAIKQELQPVERFLKEMGIERSEPQPKLSVQASAQTETETRVQVLESRL
ncbi:MAG TPA: MBL fold metallo-hydrolase [Candidatus Binatia bacterium]|jgi:L-ascorbate metabolism protein UlaG (beta-lactamase superfamily)|nr:MBL fold metallo-hydrolase [Candidatus Binatia bacterium]